MKSHGYLTAYSISRLVSLVVRKRLFVSDVYDKLGLRNLTFFCAECVGVARRRHRSTATVKYP
ncbi:hypothetical protein H6G97_31710 [Nostoc flagelliforme FACHB-838]|uniref:Transposase n=1 Tax=Nostoc flagelliforme FACHB-838 TaxID=2692904 RepID=A0ABR8DY66_9NOSO|nr:hypothetical protein [Nostoc flagelliforme]MBD2533870.1 hypothetical protein [Nostoc flagelliforme FACHB-838]